MPSSSSVNLAKKKTTIVDDLTKWALSGGRLLIIIVQIVAFSAFIYRFSLDRKINDLNDEIKGKQAIVASLKKQEDIYRNTQTRIAVAKELTNISGKYVKLLNDIINITPSNVSFSTFSAGNNKIDIEANFGSASSLSAFLKSLREHPKISTASIIYIENADQAGAVNAAININLKGTESISKLGGTNNEK